MNLSVSQRIVLTMAVTLVLFLATSLVAYQSFNAVSTQVGSVIRDASPRVYIGANLRANLADTKYLLLDFISGSSGQNNKQVNAQLGSLQSLFEADFATLEGLERGSADVAQMRSLTEKIFDHSAQIVEQKSRYRAEQAHIEKQAEEFKYLTDEMGYTLEDLLNEEFRFDYLKVLRPIRDDIAYLNGKVAELMQTDDAKRMERLNAEVEKYLGRLSQLIPEVKALDKEAHESIIEMWEPYQQQLKGEDLTLTSYLQSMEAQRRSEALLIETASLVAQNTQMINRFIEAARQYADSAEQTTDKTIADGKVLIAAGTLLAALFSAFVGFRLVTYLRRSLEQVVSGMGRIASGDLSTQLEVHGNDELTRLAESTNALSKELRHLVQEIVLTVEEVHSTAGASREISRNTLGGVEQQGLQSARLAATATEMEASAGEVAAHADQTLNEALDAESVLEANNRSLQENSRAISALAGRVTKSMDEVKSLQQHSESISEVIDVIRSIAEQTNLLALNAAIEAARAGETGRGFAVVADEVRSLANRTQGSISAIEETVLNLQNGAEATVRVMSTCSAEAISCSDNLDQSTETLRSVVAAVQRMREMNSQVATATEEQNATVRDISQSLTEINQIMEGTTRGAEQAASQSESLLQLSDNLSGLVKRFTV
ncbi:methyl-accepting chemotaxis protein [Pontibacterium granulatum]|uniref:methyl-accepting chemotaxis protein n=1 Tax=Pontibacterium granulatum TaxID=2036029 RepID=UPI00249CBE56|nr:methyl-accepting chemotaxis protein [Pontibacterium granulatum]MDI3324846.1 methyl-accepting chemotaxis protein [Pontibacterium granulatum]